MAAFTVECCVIIADGDGRGVMLMTKLTFGRKPTASLELQ